MINTYFSANLVDYNTVSVSLFSDIQKNDNIPINLIINDDKVVKLEVKKQVFLNNIALYTCHFKDGFYLGNSYKISIENYGIAPLNVNEAVNFPSFDEDYYYGGNDLGATYTSEVTTFKIWAPLASKVEVLLRKNSEEDYVGHYLKREKNGLYSLTLLGDYDNYHYLYSITNNEVAALTIDPCAKASTANGKESVIIDLNKTKIDLYNEKLPVYKSYVDTVIYELDIRDFTIDENTNIEHKGKYLGLTEENRVTKGGNKAGLDYIESLGVTHVQILPMYDFKTIDELNPSSSYNWGYDPQQYFVPEGSYSTDPNDGYSRVIECKKMIAAFHKKGIRVNMDVVFNHVYEGLFSSFEKVVPNYFYRKRKNGVLSNGSGCGNDVDTSRPMIRKFIVECNKYWTREYGIDGLRFDLMGLIDIDTILKTLKECREINPNFMIYGEGWDMNTELPSDKKSSILNSFRMEGIGFFNDTFRDVLKGQNGYDKLKEGGYFTGATNYIEGFKFVFLSSSLNFVYPPRFKNAAQSINYVECHDNFTLFDKVSSIYGKENEEKNLSIINEINAAIALSFGVPFYHAGQEIGLSKYYEDNTYNKGDKYNKFRYDVLDKRIEMSKYLASMLDFRKNHLFINEEDPTKIGKMNEFVNLENGGLLAKITNTKNKQFLIVFNPSDSRITHVLDDYYILVCSQAGYLKKSDIYMKMITVEPHQISVFLKKENN